MVQLEITQDVEDLAKEYRKSLKEKKSAEDVKTELRGILTIIPRGVALMLKPPYRGGMLTPIAYNDIRDYVDRVIKRYDGLLLMHPKGFNREIQRFEKIISKDRINWKLVYTGAVHESLAEMIIKALDYDLVRKEIYPNIARALNIKSCVYCNANYAITDEEGRGYYELDHWKPKSKYPYLSTSFYNLQVSCPSCNRRKSSNDEKKFFRLWAEKGQGNRKAFKFFISQKNIALYWIKRDPKVINLELKPEKLRNQKMLEDSENTLHISSKYKELNDEAEEVLWKAKAYNRGFYESLIGGLPKLLMSESDRKRFILGTYSKLEDVHKRPLTLMKQDVARCAGLEFELKSRR